MKRIAKYFFEGLIILVPVALSLYILFILFKKIDGLLRIPVPGLGFLVTVVAITLIGFLASNIFTKKLFELVERLFTRLPLVKLLYGSIKDLIGAFVGDKKSFDRPVAVKITGDGAVKVIGFITKDSLDNLGLNDHVAVYLPQSYNFAGNLLVLPRERIIPINADSADVMAFLVSGGVSGGKKA